MNFELIVVWGMTAFVIVILFGQNTEAYLTFGDIVRDLCIGYVGYAVKTVQSHLSENGKKSIDKPASTQHLTLKNTTITEENNENNIE